MRTLSAVALALFLAAPPQMSACSCVPRSLEEEVAQTTAIFTGKVTKLEVVEVREGVSRIEATVETGRVFKGGVPKTVVFATSNGCCYCAAWFDIAGEYLFFANFIDGQLHTDACTRTKPLSKAKEDLAYLEQAK